MESVAIIAVSSCNVRMMSRARSKFGRPWSRFVFLVIRNSSMFSSNNCFASPGLVEALCFDVASFFAQRMRSGPRVADMRVDIPGAVGCSRRIPHTCASLVAGSVLSGRSSFGFLFCGLPTPPGFRLGSSVV